MKLSVCMIVKNEEKVLEKTLPLLAKKVDEIVLVDTGSTDNTIEIAKKLGAKIHTFSWIDDFSAARNESLKHALGDWIIWVDADEFINEKTLDTLRQILEKSDKEAYYLPIYQAQFGTEEGSRFYSRLKVFKNNKGIHFGRSFNEQVYAASGELLKGEFLQDIKVFHWGKDLGEEKAKEKKERNFRILKEALQKDQNDFHCHFLLANNYFDVGDKTTAFSEYSTVVSIAPKDPISVVSRMRMSKMLMEQSKYAQAFETLKEVIALEPFNAEAYNMMGVIYLFTKQTKDAIHVFEHASKLSPPKNALNGFNIKDYTYFPHFYLGSAYLMGQKKQDALREFTIAYDFYPDPKLKARIEQLKKEVDSNGEHL
ncbi:hypothetical protein A2246_06955 [candidate division WOR-1 bacterium RIFOXYA2_FULL_37_7]|uniref:Uncharacterized protein n=1 Tax=candidate division WOR-1 bacterium RIFOXYB2_FULL_37_13 TaxID=1802579 RepID=A0A1F4SMT9_UNCSA|nr:MAG: hypothetical protein A2246_06955 [candidate division WOR-1 bacterium RIFOXYA2_FULL_37_7]OGC21756.1 MAG: hypothetical protein A2310_00420 [candidate division WOR-1 bacterium RIFOXYB2_FULL_37_13]